MKKAEEPPLWKTVEYVVLLGLATRLMFWIPISARIPQEKHEEIKIERIANDRTPGEEDQANRVRNIRRYLEQKKSPYADLAPDIVEIGLIHDSNPSLLVALFTLESSAGKNCYRNNCFGWGIHGDKKNWPGFNSVRDGFETVAQKLNQGIYAGKSDEEKMYIYNGKVSPGYEDRIMAEIKEIEEE